MEQHETVQVDKPVALAVAYFQTNSNSACNNQFFSTSLLTFTDAAVEVSDKMVSFFLILHFDFSSLTRVDLSLANLLPGAPSVLHQPPSNPAHRLTIAGEIM
jgi:hypothetical protein